MMRIAVIGTGAMGSLFSARLSAYADVTMIGSWRDQIDAVSSRGLILIETDGTQSRHDFKCTRNKGSVSPVDLALILVKSWQTARAAKLAQELLIPGGIALTLQNGLGNARIIGEYVDPAKVIAGATSEGAMIPGPGIVKHTGRGETVIERKDDAHVMVEKIVDLFRRAGFNTEAVADAEGIIWGKLAINAAINPLTALLQITNGALRDHPVTLSLMNRAAKEVEAVAGAWDIKLPYDDAATRAREVATATAANFSSMATDLRRGMPTEIEVITGAVVWHARENGIPVPVNELLLYLVQEAIGGRDWRGAAARVSYDMVGDFHRLANLEH